ncbi:MAG: hypothetical protein D6689_06940 [Deltaproteobacteria bacterium]|nr:MAG: hypothetical protein D6689_06940 [Deltaproteobacteria bacterium]
MSTAARIVAVFTLLAAAACGDQIGDSCSISSECSQTGDRFCDTTQPGGYCTVIGCDYGTCPEEAVCVRFFPAGPLPDSVPCNHATEDAPGGTDDCTFDEICTLADYCAPRSAEVRFCMKTCADDGDCRDDYECRDKQAMIAHGGEPVPPPGEPVSDDPDKFCAAAPLN